METIKNNDSGTNMDFYMFKYICPTWLGNYQNIQHIVVPPNTTEKEVEKMAKKFSNNITNSEKCDVNLLQKYRMMVVPEKSYPSLTNLSFYDK